MAVTTTRMSWVLVVSIFIAFLLPSTNGLQNTSVGDKRMKHFLTTLPTTGTTTKQSVTNDAIASCREPLGMQNGKILKNQFSFGSIYNSDPRYSPDHARLNRTEFPQGFRADKGTCGTSESFVAVRFKTKTVVTGIATQGYGDESIQEWVKGFTLYWRKVEEKNSQYKPFPVFFQGNSDPNTIVYNKIPQPHEITSILIMPKECNNNAGLRFELYGCVIKKTYVLWIRLLREHFHRDLFNKASSKFINLETKVKNKLSGHLNNFLFYDIRWFSPGSVIIELEIGAVEAEAESLIRRANKSLMQESNLGLDKRYFKVQDPLGSKTCKPPKVNLTLSKDINKPTQILRSMDHRIVSKVTLVNNLCRSVYRMVFSWTIARQINESGYFDESRELRNPYTDYIHVVRKQTLPYGKYYLKNTASMPRPNVRLFSYDYGFFEIVKTDLVASIVGPTSVFKEYNDIFSLHGKSSYDPDVPYPSYDTIQYEWYCKRLGEQWPYQLVNRTLRHRYLNVRQENETLVGSGCYGTGTGRLNESGPVLTMDIRKMESGYTYLFAMVAVKDTRDTVTTHRIRVEKDSSFMLEIKCKQNCGKYSPKERLTLEARCSGIVCNERLSYLWIVFEKDVKNGDGTSKRIRVTVRAGEIIFPVAFFDPEKQYVIKVEAISLYGKKIAANFTINENQSPSGGSCTVGQSIGEAFTTVFNFTCDDWVDVDIPLNYKFHYTNPSGVNVLLQSSPASKVSTELPVGDPNRQYEIALYVLVTDALGASTEVKIAIQVNPVKVQNSTLFMYTVGERSRLSILLKNNDVKQATNLANKVLSMMSNDGVTNMTKKDKIKLKDEMLTQMAKVEVDDIRKLIQVASVVAGVTENIAELSEASQDKSMDVLESMTSKFSQISINDSTDSTRMVNEAGTNLLHCIGNVLRTSSYYAKAPDQKTTDTSSVKNNTKITKNKQAAKRALTMIENVGDSLLKTKTTEDEAIRIKTNSIEMVLDRNKPEDLSNSVTSVGESKVAMPDKGVLLSKSGGNLSSVDTQILLLKQNPYTWDMSANKVTSPVLSIDLKDSTGKKLEISGLSKDIELIIEGPSGQSPLPVTSFAKPSVNGSMRYHTTNVTSEHMTVQITVVPEGGKQLQVYIRYKNRPVIGNYDFMATVPDYSSCTKVNEDHGDGTRALKDYGNGDKHAQEAGYFNCSADPNLITLSQRVTNYIGRYYIGIRLVRAEKNVNSRRRRRSCTSYGRQKRDVICTEFKDPPTTPPPTPVIVHPRYNPSTDVNYTISISLKSCLYWSKTKQKWTTDGCKVSPKTMNSSIVCLCNHLSSFGADFLVAPNPIDFDKVWAGFANLGKTKNFVVLSTVCTIFALYILIVILARKADRNDKQKVTSAIPVGQVTDSSYCYEITVYTGIWRRCGTTSNVAMKIYGEDNDTGTVPLTYSAMCDKKLFGRGSVNVFLLPSEASLGDIQHIKVWHDNSGKHPAWYLRQLVIRDMQTDTKWFFVCNKWLAIEKDDGRINRVFYVSIDEDINSFRNKFYNRAVTGLGDGHLWVSVVTRPPTSPFTRVQRVTCCLCVLLTAMVTNAMFYQFGEEAKDSFQFGPLVLSIKQIIIGIESSFIVLPINILIVLLFKNRKPKDENATESDERSAEQKGPGEKKKKSGCAFPHFALYVAWPLAIMASLLSAAFTMFYSMQWGREISNQWLTSILVSFSQDVMFIQPLKVILVASLLAFIIKKAPEDETQKEEQRTHTSTAATHYAKVAGEVKEPMSPKNEDLERFRQYRVRVLTMARTLIELFFYLTFAWMLMVICYGSRDVGRYWMTRGLEDILIRFDKVNSEATFWNWTETKLIPGLYNPKWYNGRGFEYDEGFISNRAGYLVGMPRFRQLRAKEDPCVIRPVYPKFSTTLRSCYPSYSFQAEYKTLYNQPGWHALASNETFFHSTLELHKMCPRPWRYRTANSLHTLPFQGVKDLYGGGGYVADLGYTAGSALRVINNLKKSNWIDEKTRAVFVEVLIFEPSSSYFSAVTYLYEKLPTGGGITFKAIKTMSLYGARSYGMSSLYAICELVLILIVMYFIVAELIKLYRQRCAYFKSAWNWLEITQVLSAIATIVLSIFRRYHASQLVEKVHNNPFMTSSFHYAVLWSEVENALMAVLIFIITVKLLRILKFNQHISLLAASMKKSARRLVSYSVVFLIAFLAFAQVALLAFGPSTTAYSSIAQVFRTQLSMFVGGDPDYQSLKDASGVLGPIYFFVFMTTMATILINMFLAILNESYREVHLFNKNAIPEEYKMFAVFVDYAGGRLKDSLSKMKDTKLFPTSHKYEVNDGLWRYENEADQKYTPIDWRNSSFIPPKPYEADQETSMLMEVKNCFKVLRYELTSLASLSRSKKYKVQEVFKRNSAGTPEMESRLCKGLKMKAKSISCSLHNMTEDFLCRKKNDRAGLLQEYETSTDAFEGSDDDTASCTDGAGFDEALSLLGNSCNENDSLVNDIEERETNI